MHFATCLAGCLLVTLLSGNSPATAQTSGGIAVDPALDELPPPTNSSLMSAGQTVESAAGQVGVRQTRSDVAGGDQMARISNRIQNRVEMRIRNRIDRYYDPRANVTSPFDVADQETQTVGQRRRR